MGGRESKESTIPTTQYSHKLSRVTHNWSLANRLESSTPSAFLRHLALRSSTPVISDTGLYTSRGDAEIGLSVARN